MKDEPFYIGYQDKIPEQLTPFIRKSFLGILFLVFISALCFGISKIGFVESRFEYGTLSELQGTLHLHPIPYLEVKAESGNPAPQTLLVGFAKFGALSSIKAMEETVGENLDGAQVVLRGTKIYYDGFQLLELTEGKHALVSYQKTTSTQEFQQPKMTNIELSGEVIDPKCYFGVMKPGYGKPHRSCASRCLAGGIPAMYVTANSSSRSYHILLDEGDLYCHFEEYIAENTRISGDGFRVGNFNFIQINSIENKAYSK